MHICSWYQMWTISSKKQSKNGVGRKKSRFSTMLFGNRCEGLQEKARITSESRKARAVHVAEHALLLHSGAASSLFTRNIFPHFLRNYKEAESWISTSAVNVQCPGNNSSWKPLRKLMWHLSRGQTEFLLQFFGSCQMVRMFSMDPN